MSNFIIQKTTTGNFYHIYNNARTKVNVSDFDVVLDDVALTFIIQCKNGSNIPSQAVSINLIQVIDLSVGTSPIPFSGIDELILLLKSISYTPYLQSLIITEPIRIYEVGQVGVFTMTPTQFTDNFDGTGLGRNTMLGWALRNGNNGTKNQQGKFSLNKGESPYDVIGAIGGSANSVLIGHSHEVGSYEKEGEPNTITYTNIGLQEGSSNLYKYTKKKGQANNGADTPSEDGVGKNMPPYLIDVWVERVTALIFSGATGGGEGGSQTWSQTLDNGRNTGGFNPLINDDDAIDFENGSYIAKGIDEGTGGNGGIEQTCSIGYKWKWEAGEIYIRNQSGQITRKENARFAPTVNDDDTKDFIANAYWEMYDGTLYTCTDNTTGAAAWEIYISNVPNLTQVLTRGDREWWEISDANYTFRGVDIATYLLNNTPVGTPIFTIDGDTDNDFPNACVLKFQTWLQPSQLVAINGVSIYFQGNSSPVTTYNFSAGDYCEVKKINAKNWWLNVSNSGDASNGLPSGGTAGQILTKVDATDYNATWQENFADWTSVVKHTVKNNGTGLISKGTAVYVTGADGTNMLVGKASNASEATSSKTMGLMQSDITTTGGTQTGFVVTEGLLSGLNTASATAGDPVWLGVNGALIYGLANKPYAPAHLVFIGIVTKVSAGNGEIFVKVQNGFELKEIHDVDLVSNAPTNNQGLVYESASSLWKNKTIDKTFVGLGNVDNTSDANKPVSTGQANALALKQNSSTLIFDSIQKAIMRDNYFWFVPAAITLGAGGYNFGTSERISGSTFTYLNNGTLVRGMLSFNTTATAGILAFSRRNDALILTSLEVVFTRKIQFNSNVSGQRFFCGISKGNQFAAPTNVEPSTLTDIVGVCQLSTSTNMHVVHNDASGTATTIDLGSSYPCNDSQYNYYITIEQTTTSYIVTVERVTIATGVSISTTNTLTTNIPNYATGVIQLLTWISNNATAAIASYLDGGVIGNVKNQ